MTWKIRQTLQVEVLDILSLSTALMSVKTDAEVKKSRADVMIKTAAFTQPY